MLKNLTEMKTNYYPSTLMVIVLLLMINMYQSHLLSEQQVIYSIPSYSIIRIVDEVSITELKDDEDFMPIELWNQSNNKEIFPLINVETF